ncbi:MAG: L-aspartate oxidase [Verrucomicrobiales bacterium]|jgi:L-aspartate oxidase
MRDYDFVVVGSGIAGLTFALQAAEHGRVCIVTKRGAEDSNTAWAQGGISCVLTEEDSFDRHIGDTLDAGAGLCREDVVRTIVTEAPTAIEGLMDAGVEFDKRLREDGAEEYDLTREGGHTKRRILHNRDATGREIESKLVSRVRDAENIELLEHHFAIDLITTSKLGYAAEDRCIGLYVFDEESKDVITIRCNRVVLCTGGSGRVYQFTTNPKIATGDGVAMAWRAGADIANMEFTQFHPTCLYSSKLKNFLISEAVRGEGGILIDKHGDSFMERYDDRKGLASRDIVARAIDTEIKRTGGPCVYIDITHKPADFIKERFPTIYENCLSVGVDATTDPIPVVPAAHYQCGGVKTDVNGETSIRGLYAIGEVACTGLHGANRLASNSLLEGAVVAHRAVRAVLRRLPLDQSALQDFEVPEWHAGDAEDVDELVVIYHNWDEVRRLMWDYVSIVRTSKRLMRATTRLHNLRREAQEFYWDFKICTELLELRNLLETASLMVECATRRKESRGLHFTLDFPDAADRLKTDTILRRF